MKSDVAQDLDLTSLCILSFEIAIALLTLIPNTYLIYKRIFHVKTERNWLSLFFAYLMNEVSLLCKSIFFLTTSKDRDVLRISIRISTYLAMLLASFILGETFKLLLKLFKEWNQSAISRLQVLVISVIGMVTFGRLVIYSNSGYDINDPLLGWSNIGGLFGSIGFKVYVLWQNRTIYNALYLFSVAESKKVPNSIEGAPLQNFDSEKRAFWFLRVRSEYQVSLCMSFWSQIVSVIAIAVDILILIFYFLQIKVAQDLALAKVGENSNVLLNILVITSIVLFESLDEINIQNKIDQQSINGAKEKAKEFIDNWRKRTNSTPFEHPPASETKILKNKVLKPYQRVNADQEKETSIGVTTSDVSLIIQTILPKSYTPDKVKALDSFKKTYPGIAGIEQQKYELQKKHAQAKKLGEEAKFLKNQISKCFHSYLIPIDQLKDIAEHKLAPPIKFEDGISFEDLSENGEVADDKNDALEISSAKYKKACSRIKSIMGEIEILQSAIETRRTALNNDFENYWQNIKKGAQN